MSNEKDLSSNTDQKTLSIETESDLGSPFLYYPPTNTPPSEVRLTGSPEPWYPSSSIRPSSPGFPLIDEETMTNSHRAFIPWNPTMQKGMPVCGNIFKPIDPPRHQSIIHPPYRVDLKLTYDQSTQTDEKLNIAKQPSPTKPTQEITYIPGGIIVDGVKYILKPPSPRQNTTGTQTNPDVKLGDGSVASVASAQDIKTATNFTKDKVSNPKPPTAFEISHISEPKTVACNQKDEILELKVSIPSEVEKTPDSTFSKNLKVKDMSELKSVATAMENPYAPKYELSPELIYQQDIPSKISKYSLETIMPFDAELSGENSSDDENEFNDI